MIPSNFNKMGISEDFEDITSGLIFHAPLTSSTAAEGGTISSFVDCQFGTRDGKGGLTFHQSYGTMSCAYQIPDFPISKAAFSIGIWYNFEASDFSEGPMAIFYVGSRAFNKQLGYQIENNSSKIVDSIYYIPDFAWQPTNYSKIAGDAFYLIGDGDWHCLVITYDNQYLNMYTDGVFNTTYKTTSLSITNKDLFIGSRINDGRGWLGYLNRVYIYNYALPIQDVVKFYNVTKRL